MSNQEHYDLIVRNATIIDGTKAPRYRGEIGVRGGRIAKLGALGKARADVEVDASGLIAAPGFIAASHRTRRLKALKRMITEELDPPCSHDNCTAPSQGPR